MPWGVLHHSVLVEALREAAYGQAWSFVGKVCIVRAERWEHLQRTEHGAAVRLASHRRPRLGYESVLVP